MKFLKYLQYGVLDEKSKMFCSFRFKLVKEQTTNKDIVEKINPEALKLLEDLNKELKKIYRGSYFFDFCLDEGCVPSDIKIKKEKMSRLKEKWLEFNNDLGKIQENFEKSLKKIDK